MLAIAGGALGLVVASFGESLVTGALADLLPRATEVQLDGFVLAFTAAARTLGLAAGWNLVDGTDTLGKMKRDPRRPCSQPTIHCLSSSIFVAWHS